MENYVSRYRAFIDQVHTERQFIHQAKLHAEQKGYVSITEIDKLLPGDRVYLINRQKNLILAHIGEAPLETGFRMVAAHVDSPRLDLKPRPLYEEAGISLLKTQYYGGIKKYQWAAIPLVLAGVVALKSGKLIDIDIGSNPTDPVFTIPDLLPHLSKKLQDERNGKEVLTGEELQVLFGTNPKESLLSILNEKYGIEEEDFLSAELELVPAFNSREIGIDRSMVAAYGQDDRACAYAAVEAMFAINRKPKQTAIVYLADKEETGSVGATGMDSQYLELAIGTLLEKCAKIPTDTAVRRTLWNSKALSADVTVAWDPVFKAVHDDQNAARLGKGIVLSKFIGPGGKMNCQDADAEFVAEIRQVLSNLGIRYQGASFGKVDEGGGGTVARFLSAKGIQVLNAGPAILGMHSPFEIAAKSDLYETFKAYQAFLNI